MQRPPKIRVRGVRQRMPPGYVVGRITPGQGPAELIRLSDLNGRRRSLGSNGPCCCLPLVSGLDPPGPDAIADGWGQFIGVPV